MDLRAWMPHLASGARLLMHDAYSSPGVTFAALREFGSREFVFERFAGSLVMFRQASPEPLVRAESCARMLG